MEFHEKVKSLPQHTMKHPLMANLEISTCSHPMHAQDDTDYKIQLGNLSDANNKSILLSQGTL